MSSNRKDYKYSVTIATDDLALVNCLRALAQYSQKTGNNRIPWGNTKDKDWERDGHSVTFRFTTPSYRKGYKAELERLLPPNLWKVVRINDNDPASSVC